MNDQGVRQGEDSLTADHLSPAEKDLAEIHAGLGRDQKRLSPKFFYDQAGSELFEAICDLPEYYLTRAELAIMNESLDDMAQRVGPEASVIEFGSGSGLKTRLLLHKLERPAAFVPVDISRDHLEESARSLADEFPELEILPVAADFTRPFPLPDPRTRPRRNLVYFPGSTIGNFDRRAALDLLKVMHQEAGENGCLLIGVDLVKDVQILERAYNDSRGITAKFNLNMLKRINAEFDGDFDLGAFRHRAVYDRAHDRIEMRLYSEEDQVVSVAGAAIPFRRGEYLITEHSHKYTLEGFRAMAAQAGFSVEKIWTDEKGWFSVHYCLRR